MEREDRKSTVGLEMKRGELQRLWRFYRFKRVKIRVVDNIDPRMHTKFLKNWMNYYPPKCNKNWIKDNYVKDRTIINLIGMPTRMMLSLEEWTEVKASYMIRNYIWKRLHLFNKGIVPQWKIKYNEFTEFEINFELR